MFLKKMSIRASVAAVLTFLLLLSFAVTVFADILSPVTNLRFTAASRYERTLQWSYPPNITPRHQVVVRSIQQNVSGTIVIKDTTLVFGTISYTDTDYVSGNYITYVVFMRDSNGSNMSSASTITYAP
ncbi:hypothetical protein [Paenibacillus paeoniae]|uniref:Uncharacterized protein n=1 Tax=Paenibacillus paeoniae TaxID=2292705 RepID=A0A371PME0_9BACL|nr:hypothetical protein [Paenibacillus paeoniae]REK76819.1 hypothetical protein DX130_07250 [Paenibacillus paeoniae]